MSNYDEIKAMLASARKQHEEGNIAECARLSEKAIQNLGATGHDVHYLLGDKVCKAISRFLREG